MRRRFPSSSPLVLTTTLFALQGVCVAAETATQLPAVTVLSDPSTTEDSGQIAAQASTVGGKLILPLKETPRAISVLTRKRLDEENITTLNQAAEKATGVYVLNQGDLSDGPMFYSRGFLMSISENGIPFDSTYYGNGLDTALYDRIEVLRGPDGLMQGQGQLGGTMNLVRKRPLAHARTGIELSAGQWDDHRAVLDLSRPLNDSGTVRARFVGVAEHKGSYLRHVGRRQYIGYGIAEADLTPDTTLWGSLTLDQSDVNPYFGGLHRGPGQGYTPRNQYGGAPWSEYHYNRKEAGLGLVHRFSDRWRLSATTSYRDYDDDKRFAYHNPHPSFGQTGRSALINRATWFEGKQWTADVHLTGQFNALGRTHDLVVGGNLERFNFENWTRNAPSLGLWPFGDTDIPRVDLQRQTSRQSKVSQSGVYAQGRFELVESLHLHLGGRFSRYRSIQIDANGNRSRAYDESAVFTPYAGLVWNVSEQWSAYASYADIFRPQSVGTEDSNGNLLDPLVGKQYEIGLKGALLDGQFNPSIALFQARDTNRAIPDPANPGSMRAAGEVKSQGFEIEVVGRPSPAWEISAGYTYTSTRYAAGPDSGNDFNLFSPRRTFKLWSIYTLRNAGALDGLSVGMGVRAFSESRVAVTAPYAVVVRQPGYAVVDARLAYPLNKHASLALNVTNLFNRTYMAYPSIRAFYGEPRRAVLQAQLKW